MGTPKFSSLWPSATTAAASVNPGNEKKENTERNRLFQTMDQSPGLRQKCWEQFISQKPSFQELIYIMEFFPELREKAWAEFTKIYAVNSDGSRRPSQAKSKNPANGELLRVMEKDSSLRERVFEILLKNSISASDLRVIILSFPELRERAWERFLKAKFTSFDLRMIMEQIDSLREDSARLLLGNNPSPYELTRIIKLVPALAGQARKQLSERVIDSDERACLLNLKE